MIGSGVTGEVVGWKGSAATPDANEDSLWGLRIGMKTGASTSSWAILGSLEITFLGFSSTKLSCEPILVVAGKFGNGDGPGVGRGAGVGVGGGDVGTSLESFRTGSFCRLPMIAL